MNEKESNIYELRFQMENETKEIKRDLESIDNWMSNIERNLRNIKKSTEKQKELSKELSKILFEKEITK